MSTEDVIGEMIKVCNDMIVKTNEINKRLVMGIVAIVLIGSVALCVIMGFYFIGQGYPDTSQTMSDGEITLQQQQTKEGGK